MPQAHGRVLTAALVALATLLPAVPAAASPVLVLDGDRAVPANDPHVPAGADLPSPPGGRTRTKARRPKGPTVYEELDRLLAEGAVDQSERDARRKAYRKALKTRKRLSGTRRNELAAVIENVEQMAARRAFTPSRLAPIFLTLERNRRWWTSGSIPRHGQRIEFAGSEVVYQYYRGEGIEIQPLATFGKANALWADGEDGELRALLNEIAQLAAERAGGIAWEYYFDFGGGRPPWTSGLSQATGLQAFARGAGRLGDPSLMDVARRGMSVFETAPPDGVRVAGPAGPHYLIYSFDSDLFVLNAFLQSVIGLHDLADLSGDPRAQALYDAGEADARVEVPRYDTGAWSLYSLERESDVHYHRLVTTFLRRLCDRTSVPVYCDTAERFTGYLDVDPVVSLITKRIRAGAPANVRVRLSKISRVGLTIRTRDGGTMVLSTSATIGYGKRPLRWSRPSRPGLYDVTLTATDLAGNRSQATGRLRILPPKRPRR